MIIYLSYFHFLKQNVDGNGVSSPSFLLSLLIIIQNLVLSLHHPKLIFAILQLMISNIKLICKKPNTMTIQFYDAQKACLCRQKTINIDSEGILLLFQNNLSLIQKSKARLYDSPFEVKVLRGEVIKIIITDTYVLQKSQNMRQITEKGEKIQNIKELLFQLLDKIGQDGNRQFFPSIANIFFDQQQIILNRISFVGVAFLRFHKNLSKFEFIQISALLSYTIFKSSSQNNQFIYIKQRGIIIFVLSLLLKKQVIFISEKEVPETVDISTAQKLIQKQRLLIKKFLKSKSVAVTIINFQKGTGLRLYRLAQKLLIDEEVLTWPEFLWELLNREQDYKQSLFKKSLDSLAVYHWESLPKIRQKCIKENGIVGECQNVEWNKKDTDLFLLQCADIPLRYLLEEGSLEAILEKEQPINSKTYRIWINFIKLLPQQYILDKFEQEQDNNKNQQANQVQIIYQLSVFNLKNNKNKQQSKKYKILSELSYFNVQFIQKFSKAKLVNRFQVNQKQIVINHENVKGLISFNQAFR